VTVFSVKKRQSNTLLESKLQNLGLLVFRANGAAKDDQSAKEVWLGKMCGRDLWKNSRGDQFARVVGLVVEVMLAHVRDGPTKPICRRRWKWLACTQKASVSAASYHPREQKLMQQHDPYRAVAVRRDAFR
jgi:hypothetical protein